MALYHIETTHTEQRIAERFTEKKKAILHARMWAAQIQQSCTVYKTDKKGTEKHIPICICEFPYYLRDCININYHDIYVNMIEI